MKECVIYDSREDSAQSDVWFDDEMINLDKKLNGKILIIADLGLWDGHKSAYKFVPNNLQEVLLNCCGDDMRVYYNGKDIVCDDYHHDSTNHYIFYELKVDENNDGLNKILNKIYNQEEYDKKELKKYVKSLGKYVKKIYGW